MKGARAERSKMTVPINNIHYHYDITGVAQVRGKSQIIGAYQAAGI
jgi:hypothetical protein